ncbi:MULTISPECIES: hypothetical protein [Cupriavidus]|uniref:hypothetical protein n=1 Tax=Cupriavidus sp. DF5525 TaxID=3160989 RepID=UPI0032E044B4
MLSVNPWPHLASQLVNRDGKDQQIPLKDAIDAITTHAPACSLNLAVRDAFRATLAEMGQNRSLPPILEGRQIYAAD